MKVNRTALASALRLLARVPPTKPHIAVLSSVHLRANGGSLVATTTDGAVWLSATLPVEGDIETLLPAKLLAQLTKVEGKASGTETVSIEVLPDKTIGVTVDGLTSKLVAPSFEDYLLSPSLDGIALVALWPAAELQAGLGYVLPAVSGDVTRPHLNGVNLEGQRAVSTDGHRLHTATLPSVIAEPLFLSTAAAVVLERLLGAADQVVLARSDELLVARCGHWTLAARIQAVSFPPCDQVIPALDRQAVHLEVDAKLLNKALDRVTKLSPSRQVKVSVNGAITLATSDYELGEAETVVPTLANNHTGPDLVTGFCATYIAEALGGNDGVAHLAFGGALDPLRIDMAGARRQLHFLAVIMPMRV